MRMTMLVAALMLVGCGGAVSGHGIPRGGETITYTYSSSPLCQPNCPNYTITLGPDGQGIFARNDTTRERRRFRASREQTAAFSKRLHPYRPNGVVTMTDGGLCRTFVTDGDQMTIDWTAADGRPAHLLFNTGCDEAKHRKMAAAIADAPSLLPIADLLARR